MGAVLICKQEQVKTPYYIESMGIRLYSMEELACIKIFTWWTSECWGYVCGTGFARR